MPTLADVLILFAVLSAVQFTARSLRNVRDALRLVPIGSMTPSMVRDHKTVPLCFVGGETLLANMVTYVCGRLWVRPRGRKQAALCDQVVFLDREYKPLDRNRRVGAGTVVQVIVSEGEDRRHIRRSARRCRRGTELVLAILFPTEDGERYTTQIRCVAVRSRARSVWDSLDGVEPIRVIEWEVIDPVGLRTRTDSSLERYQVPLSAFWLVSNGEQRGDDPVRMQFGKLAYAYGSNRLYGFVARCTTIAFRLLLLVIGLVAGVVAAVLGGVTHNDPLSYLTFILLFQLAGVLLSWKSLIYLLRLTGFIEKLRPQGPYSPREHWWPRTYYVKSPWHGATRRSLALGDRIRRVAFWQRVRFLRWEPLIEWPLHALREWMGARGIRRGSESAKGSSTPSGD